MKKFGLNKSTEKNLINKKMMIKVIITKATKIIKEKNLEKTSIKKLK